MLTYPISVFLDTNIFINAKYDFSSKGNLYKLKKYINDGKISLFISDIVENEVKKHLNEDATKLCNFFKDARANVFKNFSFNMLEDTGISNLFEKIDKDALKRDLVTFFEKFLEESKVTILDNSGVDCNQIISDYFSSNPPFETKDSKKHEFPDAIMSAKLKLLFNVINPIYIISNDSGFRSSFSVEKGFNTFDSLKEVFNLINIETEIYENMTDYLSNQNTHNLICDMLKNELSNSLIDVNGLDCDRKGFCEGYDYEEVYIDEISQVDFVFSSVDEITEGTVSTTISCMASISAICSYLDEANSAWDSEEGEYVYTEWGHIEENHQPNFDCEVVFSICRQGKEINFGIESMDFSITLDQWTRISRRYIEPEDPAETAHAEYLEALEEYSKH